MKASIVLFWLIAGAVAPAMAKMNVVVILTDDQRFDTVSYDAQSFGTCRPGRHV